MSRQRIVQGVVLVLAAAAVVLAIFGRGAVTRTIMGASSSACRLRLVELALATRETPSSDTLLARGGKAIPWPPLAHSGLVMSARAALPPEAIQADRGSIDEAALESHVGNAMRVLGCLAALAAALAARSLGSRRGEEPVDARASGWLGFAAAFAVVALPPTALASRIALVDSDLAVALLGSFELFLCARCIRARAMADLLPSALIAGLVAGLALLASRAAWPIGLAAIGALLLARRLGTKEERREVFRAAVLFGLAATVVLSFPNSSMGAESLWPSFALGWNGMLQPEDRRWLYALIVPAAAWLVASGPMNAERTLLLGFAAATFVLGALDARFEPAFAASLPPLIALALHEIAVRFTGRARRAALGSALTLLAFAAVMTHVHLRFDASAEPVDLAGLRWMRDHTPSSGPWNNSESIHNYAVLCDPRFAGAVAYYARRPALAASFSGVAVGDQERAAANALLLTDIGELTARMHAMNTPYLVATAPSCYDLLAGLGPAPRPAGDRTVLEQCLAFTDASLPDSIPGLERVFVSLERWPAREGGDAGTYANPPAFAIYKLTAPPPERAPAQLGAK